MLRQIGGDAGYWYRSPIANDSPNGAVVIEPPVVERDKRSAVTAMDSNEADEATERHDERQPPEPEHGRR